MVLLVRFKVKTTTFRRLDLFSAQRKELIADAEALITQLHQVGYRISAQVVEQLKQQF